MLLITAQEVADAIGVTYSADRDQFIDAAIEKCTTVIESILRTSLSRQDVCEYFSFTGTKSYKETYTELYLASGFLDKTVDVDVYYSSEGFNLANPDYWGTIIPDWEIDIDYEKGYVTIPSIYIYSGRNTLLVEYRKGFEVDSNDLIVDGYQVFKDACIEICSEHMHSTNKAERMRDFNRNISPILMNKICTSLREYQRSPLGKVSSNKVTYG